MRMSRNKKLFSFAFIAMTVLWSAHPRLALAEQPMERIKSAIERVSEVLQDVSTKTGPNKAEAAQTIREIILPSFDFAEMARRSLGSQWQNLDGRQSEFVGAFADFVENSYMNTLASYRGEKVVYLRESISQNLAQVDTQVVARKGNPLSVNYRLHLTQGDWKVYDVVVDNIGLVSNFRAQFKRILATASLDDLLKKLREKSAKPA
jgi:phospholipid transport system substrate-binding protein